MHVRNFQKSKIVGIDFSGAEDAGKRIWISSGVLQDNCLIIEYCSSLSDIVNKSPEPLSCLAELSRFILKMGDSAIGLDFPFSLPYTLFKVNNWLELLNYFTDNFFSPQSFRDFCRQAGGNRELKRITDILARAPWSPYNLRLYRQTYYGIKHLLLPLAVKEKVSVIPMQTPVVDKPWIFEVCPACTLKWLNLYYRPYKGAEANFKQNRIKILGGLENAGLVYIGSKKLNHKIVNEKNGDALDSVVCAVAAMRAVITGSYASLSKYRIYSVEGYIFV